ncbi:hypothetical protein [Kitasatospora cathayae]|uniref:Uncharacterized protein n=1 Tax=Kitasatospora cathayae TaxID=3004092 RepID=A0ABY7Q2X6_9ACTN|nr:hypothetical protein [Kitasatospora sp. HUAS 3-15]WBP87017.1 hypothetical protein O1G21_14985 [Kitasatospora sp. HUAS 3-15]
MTELAALDPQTEADALKVFQEYQAHTNCPDCGPGFCARLVQLQDGMKAASQRALTPYVVKFEDSTIRGAWDADTAHGFVRRYGGTIVKAPKVAKQRSFSMIAHEDPVIENGVGRAWVSEERDGKWLNIQVVMEYGKVGKILRFREDDAHFLRASVVDAMRPVMSELDARQD